MSSFINRRAALGVLGLGGISFLAACGPVKASSNNGTDSSSANNSASPSSSSSASASSTPNTTSGTVTLEPENYEGDKDKMKTATKEHKASDVPHPTVPAGMDTKSKEGLYAFARYWAALWNYTVMTGKVEEYLARMVNSSYNMQYQVLASMYSNNTGWVYVDTADEAQKKEPMHINLQSTKGAVYKDKDEDTYILHVYIGLNDTKIHNTLEEGSSDEYLRELLSFKDGMGGFHVKFVDGKWKFLKFDGEFSSSKAEEVSL